jgi:hypothetical protein
MWTDRRFPAPWQVQGACADTARSAHRTLRRSMRIASPAASAHCASFRREGLWPAQGCPFLDRPTYAWPLVLGSPRQGAGEEKVPPERGSFGRRQSGTSWFVAESPSRVVARLPQRPRKWAGLAGTFSRFGPSTPSGQRPPQRLPTACVLLNSSAVANPPTVLVASRRTATRAMLGATWLSTVSYFTGRLHRQIGCLLPQNQRAAALRHCVGARQLRFAPNSFWWARIF